MQHQWLRWVNGYLVIILEGTRIERFINLAVQRRMQIWNIARYQENRGKMAVGLEDFYRLKSLLKETGCRMRIVSKHGFPFFLTRVKERYAFFAGFFIFIIMLFLLSQVIWTVQVIGTEKISKQAVLQAAWEIGIQQGKFRFMLDDPDKIQAQLMAKLPEASWIGFQMQGTRAQIRVVEKITPDPRQTRQPRNLVAKKSAIIHHIFVEKGKPMVRPDDFVRKGDVLVSGLIGREDQPLAVAAEGKVEGEVWYETEVTIPLKQERTLYTGEKHQNVYLSFGDYKIKIWGYGDIGFKEYTSKQETRVFRWRDFALPVGWTKEEQLGIQTERVNITVQEAQAMAVQAAKQDVLAKMGNGGFIKEEKVLHLRQENDKVYIKMHLIAIEDIAIEQPIFAEGD